MRVVLLLVVLVVIGMTLAQWLGGKPPTQAVSGNAPGSVAVPKAPTRPQDVKRFEQDINRFIQEAARQRANQENTQ